MDEVLQQPANEAHVPHCSAAELAERRYLKALDELVADAWEVGQMQTLADSLAWTAARIASGFGVGAAGDILRRMGHYIGEFEARRRAEDEAEDARKQGREPH